MTYNVLVGLKINPQNLSETIGQYGILPVHITTYSHAHWSIIVNLNITKNKTAMFTDFNEARKKYNVIY
jgi:hypothetical protein